MPPDFTEILDVQQVGPQTFRCRSRAGGGGRSFGGEVAAQALVAAGRTVQVDRQVHSLHAYFLRPGDPSEPLVLTVDTVREGRSFAARRVAATQHGQTILELTASFAVAEDGVSHQRPRTDAPDPDGLPDGAEAFRHSDERTRAWDALLREVMPIELRFPEEPPRVAIVRGETPEAHQRLWLRSARALPEDPLVHAGALTFASDMLLLSAALPPHRAVVGDPGVQVASLDHAIWFHAPARLDDWLLYEQEGSWTGNGRGLCRGQIFDRHGTLVASVAQEGLVRVPLPAP